MQEEVPESDEIISVHPSQGMTLLLFLLIALFSTLLGMAIIAGMSLALDTKGADIIANMGDSITSSERYFLRASIAINHISMFIVPGLLLAWFLRRKKWAQFLSLHQAPPLSLLGLGALFLLVGLPLAQAGNWLNELIPLPSWAQSMEESTAGLVRNLLAVDHPLELLLNVIVIAVIPALGEEFIFRGILQKQLAKQWDKPVLAIWLAAFLFSAFHFQFEGFIARLILGALLGYLFYWTKNLWVPIFAHFVTNAVQIIAQYFVPDKFETADALENANDISWPVVGLSLVLVFLLSRSLMKSQAAQNASDTLAINDSKNTL